MRGGINGKIMIRQGETYPITNNDHIWRSSIKNPWMGSLLLQSFTF